MVIKRLRCWFRKKMEDLPLFGTDLEFTDDGTPVSTMFKCYARRDMNAPLQYYSEIRRSKIND